MRRSGYIEEGDLREIKDASLVKRLIPFGRPHGALFVGALCLVALLTLLDLSIPWITKEAIDRYIVPKATSGHTEIRIDRELPEVQAFLEAHPEVEIRQSSDGSFIQRQSIDKGTPDQKRVLRSSDIRGVGVAALFLLGALFLNFLFGFAQTFVLETMGQRIIFDLRMALFSHIRRLPLAWFHENPTGRIVTRLTGDIENLREMFTSVITFVFKDLFLLMGIAITLFFMDARLAGITFLVIPVAIFIAIFFATRSRTAFRKLRVRIAEINARLAENLSGMTIIRLFAREEETDKAFRKLSHRHFSAGMEQVRIFALFMPVIEVLNASALGLIIFYGGSRVLSGPMTLGALVAYISYLRMFFRPIRDIAEKYNILQNAFSSAERIFHILDTPLAHDEKDRGKIPQAFEELTFENLSFGYTPEKPVLKEVNLSITRGETIAIVGPTGAGKTSIVSLLVRFWDPQKGVLRINGTPLSQLNPLLWRKQVAMVMQDPFLFAGTIAENILPEKTAPELTPEIKRTLEDAGCHFVLDRLPQGLHTPLTEGGKPLSSGERQLLSIARAFFRNPELLILDEATSYVDSLSESAIQEALNRLMKDRTTLLIAHRLSTARNADRIVVVKNGAILEEGSHQDLMAQNGLYSKMQRLEVS